ncbi:uncharacterized protein BXZ73DRAFT_102840 [Epithele typhae]|uniref:uncharacterized protein n=1 Tax=Epithele typhae TaxID=378194 RepID=UPI002007BB85|nr:uncharacterized protein BXZ73DRAFT_102840 [Epithele typhae]KAH9926580.1 hypothetical protein BXZ73DRAFT_102840 [Epithele typhae]
MALSAARRDWGMRLLPRSSRLSRTAPVTYAAEPEDDQQLSLSNSWRVISHGAFTDSRIGIVLLVAALELVRGTRREYDVLLQRTNAAQHPVRALQHMIQLAGAYFVMLLAILSLDDACLSSEGAEPGRPMSIVPQDTPQTRHSC